jgi:hypothetical protein
MSDPNQEFQAPPPPTTETEPERDRPVYLLYAGIGLVVVGIIVAVLGIVGMITGGAGTGGAFAALGILFVAFSFMRVPAVPNPPPRMSTVGTLAGIFFEPTSVFRNLRAHPQFMAAVIIVGLLNGIYVAAFVSRLSESSTLRLISSKRVRSNLRPKRWQR